MDFSRFDQRGYRRVSVESGYDEWSTTYDATVRDEMDLRLLERIDCIDFSTVRRAVDLACGTGRVGVWLRAAGVGRVDGIDLSAAMLERAAERGVYDVLRRGGLDRTPFPSCSYELATASLVDEHLPDLGRYADQLRAGLASPGGLRGRWRKA